MLQANETIGLRELADRISYRLSIDGFPEVEIELLDIVDTGE